MARPLRIEYPGAWYHVLNRSAQRRRIFSTPGDRDRFFDLLADLRKMWNVEIHAFCLLDNHYHLVIHTPDGNLSRALRHLDGVYTQRFNRAHGVDGPLFRGRFKASVVEREEYLLELVRYVHLNPVKAGLVRLPSGYPWSSHRHYLRPECRPNWLAVDEVLSRFGKRHGPSAAKKFDQFVREGVPPQMGERLERNAFPAAWGSDAFRDWLRYNFIDPLKAHREVPEARRATRRLASFPSIVREVADHYSMPRQKLGGSTPGRPNEARDLAIYLMRRAGGAGHAEIGAALGGLRPAAVAQSLRRFLLRLRENNALQERADIIADHLLSLVQI